MIHPTEKDAANLRRIQRWAESYEPGQSMTVSRDLLLQLAKQAEAASDQGAGFALEVLAKMSADSTDGRLRDAIALVRSALWDRVEAER